MDKKLVLKRLSNSDLTIFEHHYRNTSGAKQKAFNLDISVFVTELYPTIPERMDLARDRIPLDLLIYGPGASGLHNLQRKILKQQKNWRLNGELIYSPHDDEHRYDCLEKNDYALIEFFGSFEPERACIYLIASSHPRDADLYRALAKYYEEGFSSRKGMQSISRDDLASVLLGLRLPDEHPVLDFVESDALEDAVYGGLQGSQSLRKRRKARGVSLQEFALAKQRAEKNGFLGEEIVNSWLSKQVSERRVPDFQWEAKRNAVAPYDFIIFDNGKKILKIDVKTTSGNFLNNIHVSISELYEMSEGGVPYKIYRLYHLSDNKAKLRISCDMKKIAADILSHLSALPYGVAADGVTISPKIIDFENEFIVSLDDSQ